MTCGETGGAAHGARSPMAGAAKEASNDATVEAGAKATDATGTGTGTGTAGKAALDAVIVNQRGLHARASAQFVRCAERFDADVTVTKDGQTVGGTSIMGLMMLAAGIGSTVTVRAEGPEADVALSELRALIESGFGEES